MNMNSLKELYVEQLRDLYSAEGQLLQALPKMAEAVSHDELRNSMQMHLEQTRQHEKRLKQLFQDLGESPDGHECKAMKGLIEEGQELLSKKGSDPDVLDAGIIAAAQRIEHYEIAGYGTVRTYAETLGESDAVRTLQQTLDEEGQTDKMLTQIAERVVNRDAMQG